MVDRMGEIRGWQREAGLAVEGEDEPGARSPPGGADSKAKEASSDDSGVVQVRLLLQRYAWSSGPVVLSGASCLDGASGSSGSERSIEDIIGQMDEATERVNQLTAERVRLASEHARDASQRGFETCVQRVSALHLEAKSHLEMVHHENVEYWARNANEYDGGIGTIRRNLHSHVVGHYRAALARFRAAADGAPQSPIATPHTTASTSVGGYRGAVEAETRRRVGLALGPSAGEAQVDRVMKGGAEQIQSVLRGNSLDPLNDEVEGLNARHGSILALERKVHELAQLFGDLALIVDEGQMSIDNIEHHLRRAEEHVKRGAKELERGKSEQDKARQAQCAIAGLVMLALGAITAPLVFK